LQKLIQGGKQMNIRRLHVGVGILCILAMVFVMIAVCGCGKKTPSISSISPSSGEVGTEITIKGSDFGDSQGSGTAEFGSVKATVESWSDSAIKTKVPTGLDAGEYDVAVTNADGNSAKAQFEVTEKKDDSKQDGQADKNTPEEAIEDYTKKAGGDPTGWTYSEDKVSKEDPDWAIYKGVSPLPPEQEPPDYFLLHKVDGEWTVLADGTDFNVQDYGGPSDLAW
jgi:hypothetical protein